MLKPRHVEIRKYRIVLFYYSSSVAITAACIHVPLCAPTLLGRRYLQVDGGVNQKDESLHSNDRVFSHGIRPPRLCCVRGFKPHAYPGNQRKFAQQLFIRYYSI